MLSTSESLEQLLEVTYVHCTCIFGMSLESQRKLSLHSGAKGGGGGGGEGGPATKTHTIGYSLCWTFWLANPIKLIFIPHERSHAEVHSSLLISDWLVVDSSHLWANTQGFGSWYSSVQTIYQVDLCCRCSLPFPSLPFPSLPTSPSLCTIMQSNQSLENFAFLCAIQCV